MTRRISSLAWLALLLLVVAACEDSTADIIDKTRNVGTVAQLKKALGDPDDIAKLGPLAKWTYKAKDGTVTFLIAGTKVTTSIASTKKDAE